MKTLILARSSINARALDIWLELLEDNPLEEDASGQIIDSRCLLQSEHNLKDPAALFEKVAARLWEHLNGFDKRVTVLVDALALEHLNPMNYTGWETMVAMCVLAFPEIQWKFRRDKILGPQDEELNLIALGHSLPSLFQTRFDPIFDGSGLRNWIRENAKSKKENRVLAPYLPLRLQWACALDDEVSYAYFNGYVAYRFGFRAHVLRRFKPTKSLLGKTLRNAPTLTFEDVFLNFPDKPNDKEDVRLSDLEGGRNREFPLLDKAKFRRFVTSSQTVTSKDGIREKNRSFIRSRGRSAMGISKPLSGIFDLWKKAKMQQCLKWRDAVSGKTIRGVGEGYLWPPPKRLLAMSESTGHGSPGRLLQIAESMIHRATQILDAGVTTVRQAVTGAVLATDAIELLGNRTPTTSIEALCLKHQFEVLAECQFSGTEYHIEIKARLKEIRSECEELSRWFHPKQAKMAAWNAEMHIVNQLVRILQEHNQFDEEAECMHRVRVLHNRLWIRDKPLILRPLLIVVSSYATWLMASFAHFVISVTACILLLSGLRWIVDHTGAENYALPQDSVLRMMVLGFQEVYSFFVGANTFGDQSWGVSLLQAVAATLGLVHLGIFLSYLYSIISRKS